MEEGTAVHPRLVPGGRVGGGGAARQPGDQPPLSECALEATGTSPNPNSFQACGSSLAHQHLVILALVANLVTAQIPLPHGQNVQGVRFRRASARAGRWRKVVCNERKVSKGKVNQAKIK